MTAKTANISATIEIAAPEPATELRWVSSVLGLMTSEHSFILSPTSGGTQLVQTQTYRGMFTRFPPRPSAVSRPASRRSIKRSGSEPRTAAHEGPDVPVPGPGLNIQTGTKVVRYNKDDSAAPKGQ